MHLGRKDGERQEGNIIMFLELYLQIILNLLKNIVPIFSNTEANLGINVAFLNFSVVCSCEVQGEILRCLF